MFKGYEARENHFAFDSIMKKALKVAGKGKAAKRNPELQEAIELERKGYSKPDMTQDELR